MALIKGVKGAHWTAMTAMMILGYPQKSTISSLKRLTPTTWQNNNNQQRQRGQHKRHLQNRLAQDRRHAKLHEDQPFHQVIQSFDVHLHGWVCDPTTFEGNREGWNIMSICINIDIDIRTKYKYKCKYKYKYTYVYIYLYIPYIYLNLLGCPQCPPNPFSKMVEWYLKIIHEKWTTNIHNTNHDSKF